MSNKINIFFILNADRENIPEKKFNFQRKIQLSVTPLLILFLINISFHRKSIHSNQKILQRTKDIFIKIKINIRETKVISFVILFKLIKLL